VPAGFKRVGIWADEPFVTEAGDPRTLRLVTPELALVDPELNAWARARLPDSRSEPPRARAALTVAEVLQPDFRAIPPPEVPAWELPSRRRRGRLFLVTSIAAALAAGLVLADVKVEVGKTPAAANDAPRVLAVAGPPVTVERPPADTRPAQSGPLPRRFAWAPLAGATGYHVEFFRGSKRVFAADTQAAQIDVPAAWHLGGRTQALEPGAYRWYVWPVTPVGRAHEALVQAKLVVPAR
jgi:hypothetical protein